MLFCHEFRSARFLKAVTNWIQGEAFLMMIWKRWIRSLTRKKKNNLLVAAAEVAVFRRNEDIAITRKQENAADLPEIAGAVVQGHRAVEDAALLLIKGVDTGAEVGRLIVDGPGRALGRVRPIVGVTDRSRDRNLPKSRRRSRRNQTSPTRRKKARVQG